MVSIATCILEATLPLSASTGVVNSMWKEIVKPFCVSRGSCSKSDKLPQALVVTKDCKIGKEKESMGSWEEVSGAELFGPLISA